MRLCQEAFFLPATGNECFLKVHNFPCKFYAKSASWKFVVGFRHVSVNPRIPFTRLKWFAGNALWTSLKDACATVCDSTGPTVRSLTRRGCRYAPARVRTIPAVYVSGYSFVLTKTYWMQDHRLNSCHSLWIFCQPPNRVELYAAPCQVSKRCINFGNFSGMYRM